ncbi:hypothetical protein JM79_3242 [Gramella sp. Hel_I_59]|uniref:hypothetical protein n=1 Tax=Gramella sp. Hel_I_59 TaxID=1249978 RepID=UPI00115274FB|nr:hypothetical protein [Gramella sp. Hel_I_59]TQI72284.1 hypothetical protein JM79_3242 [Gramella sp. Hel_I_59]
MNKLKLIFQAIKAFFYSLTPQARKERREEKYYEEALKNMQGPEALELFQKRILQRDINDFLNRDKKIRILPETQKVLLVKDKFRKDLKLLKLTVCPETIKLISA